MSRFIPRDSFPIPSCIPHTYFSGHHVSAMERIKKLLPTITLVLECRDFRLPLSTHNPHLEKLVSGHERIVVYTKADLGADSVTARKSLRTLRTSPERGALYGDFFWERKSMRMTEALVLRIRRLGCSHADVSPLGLRTLLVGMPNVGKSTLLNQLRAVGNSSIKVSERRKAARTGDQAGVTRSVSTPVRIWDPLTAMVDGGKIGGPGAYVIDTPGIFMPYVHDGETMIKLALTNGIKKGLIPDDILADYLLYCMNRWKPSLYRRYSEPTNDINEFLVAVAKREGKLKARGVPDLHEAASLVLSRWREGRLGRFVIDDLSPHKLEEYRLQLLSPQTSLNQAKKMAKTAVAGS
ncbi:hypothetical protein XA68_12681 [Ophiocordyceps unilateralis]|uniref:G domain-containing protein n=1 Tax=Ophiocordyceps unilateralis TaxID=268505 RepID=A0A2A9PE70_OPHUN|nr:hypothetical protein XA68_12681 [Ophiocordyceps unilateralis]